MVCFRIASWDIFDFLLEVIKSHFLVGALIQGSQGLVRQVFFYFSHQVKRLSAAKTEWVQSFLGKMWMKKCKRSSKSPKFCPKFLLSQSKYVHKILLEKLTIKEMVLLILWWIDSLGKFWIRPRLKFKKFSGKHFFQFK